jgi:gamma-glutamyl:cysteine ligase YbdK (ATP-grasp superfamily)
MESEDGQLHSCSPATFHLFQAFGVELEYMIVDQQTLGIRPISDQLLHQVAGAYVSEVELGEIAWSNELALHVIELKTNGPAESLTVLPERMQQHVGEINRRLAALDACLMPTAMHPWMDPWRELHLWPHEHNPIYEAYHRIFDCRGHGWTNLQSVHLNLPFAEDEEFGRLHAAIRLLIPVLPAIAASSPVVERTLIGPLDHRMEVYRQNSRRVPSVTGSVVPEAVYTRADYEREILQRIYADIAPLDPDAILREEWLNARGAIARFDRNTIEIRVLDVQECPQADLAICAIVTAVLQALCHERWTDTAQQQAVSTEPLAQLLLATIQDAEHALIRDRDYLAHFGLANTPVTAGALWRHLIDTLIDPQSAWFAPLQCIVRQGPLARRIVRALQPDPNTRLPHVYRQLCDCLAMGKMFSCPDQSDLS